MPYVFRRRLQDVLVKTHIFVLAIRLQDVFRTSSRYFDNVFKKSSRRLEKRPQNIFKTSSRRLAKISSRRFQNVSSSWTVLVNTSLRSIQHVSETFFSKDDYLQRICPGNTTSDKFMVSVQNLQEIKISQVLVFQFTTPLVAAYRCAFRTWSNIYNRAFLRKYFKLLTLATSL